MGNRPSLKNQLWMQSFLMLGHVLLHGLNKITNRNCFINFSALLYFSWEMLRNGQLIFLGDRLIYFAWKNRRRPLYCIYVHKTLNLLFIIHFYLPLIEQCLCDISHRDNQQIPNRFYLSFAYSFGILPLIRCPIQKNLCFVKWLLY